jgi:BCCT family betaine/carnitine transporter
MSEQTIGSQETVHEIGDNNITPFGLDIHNPVFLVSGLSVVIFVLITFAAR